MRRIFHLSYFIQDPIQVAGVLNGVYFEKMEIVGGAECLRRSRLLRFLGQV